MADPLSIAGLAASVISLGLEVAGGLSDYLDGVKGRVEELSSAKRQATNMKDLLLTIKDLLPQVKNSWPTSATSIERHVQSCNTEISALYTLLSELSQPASSSSGIRLKLAEQKQKLTYPFNRAHLGHLEERLVKVNSALQIALQITGLDVSITTRNDLQQVHNSSVTTGNQVQQLHDVSITTGNQVQEIRDVSIATRDELRQMRDELRAMCQSTTVRAQSTATCLSLTASESPESMAKGGVGVPLDSIEAAVSLASKPSLLSTSIETVIKCNTSLSPRGNGSLTCFCRPSRKMSHYRKSWGYFSFSYKTLNTRRHLPSCPLSQIDSETRTINSSIEYNGLKRLLQTAFVLSFADSYGAGGRSIGPSFTYYPTVYEGTAPAFRIMDLALSMVESPNCTINTNGVAKVLQHCFDNILILYGRGKACPRDINFLGESIMHLVTLLFCEAHNNGLRADVIISWITTLVRCGVPVTTYDSFGETVCGRLLQQACFDQETVKLAKLLLPNAPDVPLVQYTRVVEFPTHNVLFLGDLSLAEAAGCGPLSLAAIAGDEKLMQEIIRRHPESLEEVDQFGHTPLHLAINRPSCLRLILNTSGPSLLEKQDIFLQIPLDYACLSGCKESVRLFLTSGSRITYWCLEAVHDSCQNDLLLALKHRRDELKRLALDNLTRTEAESLGLYENAVLDANAIEVQRLLYSRGVNIPPRLYVERMWHASVYHWSISNDNSVSSFDQLWALGFRDIDCLNSNGRTPMMEDNSLDAVRWLIEHGANYWTPLNERSDSTKITEPVTPTHSILGKMGDALGHEKEYLEFLKAHQWLIEKLLRVRVGDACSCPCSVGGCTPWKAFLDGMVRYQSYAPTLYYPAALCVAVIEAFQTCLGQDDLSLLVRRMTFDALELTHTCCRFANYISEYTAARHTSEEIDEINSEQRALLTLFADLMDEFEQVAFEDQCGTPLIASDPEGFWVRRWLPRIRETLDTLDGDDLTPEEKSAAEAIGVVWGPQPVHRTECEDEDDELDWGSPEWVMREMEKIMNK